jgi:hypothetical protein
VLRDSDIKQLADRLSLYSRALEDLATRSFQRFMFKVVEDGDLVYVSVYHVDNLKEKLFDFTVKRNAVIEEFLRVEEHKSKLVRRMLNTLVDLAREVSSKVSVSKRIS